MGGDVIKIESTEHAHAMPSLALAMMAASATGFFWLDHDTAYAPRTYQLYDYRSTADALDVARSVAPPRWSASDDVYELKMRLPDLEPKTVSAALASDGKKIELVGERKIEGCSCRPSTVKEIALPYRPRAEDVDVSVKDGLLSIRLARHAQANAATPLTVTLIDEPKDKEADAPADASQRRPLRFVPHASAVDTTERSADAKERSAAFIL